MHIKFICCIPIVGRTLVNTHKCRLLFYKGRQHCTVEMTVNRKKIKNVGYLSATQNQYTHKHSQQHHKTQKGKEHRLYCCSLSVSYNEAFKQGSFISKEWVVFS